MAARGLVRFHESEENSRLFRRGQRPEILRRLKRLDELEEESRRLREELRRLRASGPLLVASD